MDSGPQRVVSDAIVAMICLVPGVELLMVRSRGYGVCGCIENAGQIGSGLESAVFGRVFD